MNVLIMCVRGRRCRCQSSILQRHQHGCYHQNLDSRHEVWQSGSALGGVTFSARPSINIQKHIEIINLQCMIELFCTVIWGKKCFALTRERPRPAFEISENSSPISCGASHSRSYLLLISSSVLVPDDEEPSLKSDFKFTAKTCFRKIAAIRQMYIIFILYLLLCNLF